MTTKNQRGSAHTLLLLGILVVAIIGYAGYRVMQHQNDIASKTARSKNSTAPASAPPDSTSSAAIPAKIQTKAQAQQATQALDAELLDTTLDTTQLDSDLNSLL